MKQRFQLKTSFLFVLLVASSMVDAQQMHLKISHDGIASDFFRLSEINKIIFSAGSMHVLSSNGMSTNFPLTELNKLSFQENANSTQNTYNRKNTVVYPNPVFDKLYIIDEKEIESVSIIDLLGNILFFNEVKSNSTEINVANLVRGTYLIRIKSKNVQNTYKVSKH